MGRLNLDLDGLRALSTGVALGSFAKAADRLGRSTSAVSAQLKKLEEQIGAPILRKAGRVMVPTAAGEVLLSYARRLLDLNDEAVAAVRGVDLEGCVRLGLQEDFGEIVLTDVLGHFARAHPRVRVEARVARNADLLGLVTAGRLDLTLAWDDGFHTPHSHSLTDLPLRWIGAAAHPELARTTDRGVLPLVVFDAPCLMRQAATAALDRAGIAWRVAFTTASLSGIWAAVAAGLGVTVRTEAGLPGNLCVLDPAMCGLPELSAAGLRLHRAGPALAPAVRRLEDLLCDALIRALPEGVDRGMRAHISDGGGSSAPHEEREQRDAAERAPGPDANRR